MIMEVDGETSIMFSNLLPFYQGINNYNAFWSMTNES